MKRVEIEAYRDHALDQIKVVEGIPQLDELKTSFLGKKSPLSAWMKQLGSATPEERQELGALLHEVRSSLLAQLQAQRLVIGAGQLKERLASEALDMTLSPRPLAREVGRLHPLSYTLRHIIHLFAQMGFAVMEGPDIEDDFHNFSALNIPPHHPARTTHDTFYFPKLSSGTPLLLRTHTSTVQIRTMMQRQQGEEIRIIAPGRVYRADYDQTHTPMFHQVEVLAVGQNLHFGHMKGCLQEFLELFFERKNLGIRLRPSFFPFTEPSAEVDVRCTRSRDELIIGEGEDWLEILGCGMVHPNVFAQCGLDPDQTQGFAIGMGVERMAMLKYGISDLRRFYENDQRWLGHYGFAPCPTF